MSLKCEECGREFSRHASLRNHVKTHNSAIDKILREISEEIDQPEQVTRDIERGDEEEEETIMIIDENNQLENENEMDYEYEDQLGEELTEDRKEELNDFREEKL